MEGTTSRIAIGPLLISRAGLLYFMGFLTAVFTAFGLLQLATGHVDPRDVKTVLGEPTYAFLDSNVTRRRRITGPEVHGFVVFGMPGTDRKFTYAESEPRYEEFAGCMLAGCAMQIGYLDGSAVGNTYVIEAIHLGDTLQSYLRYSKSKRNEGWTSLELAAIFLMAMVAIRVRAREPAAGSAVQP